MFAKKKFAEKKSEFFFLPNKIYSLEHLNSPKNKVKARSRQGQGKMKAKKAQPWPQLQYNVFFFFSMGRLGPTRLNIYFLRLNIHIENGGKQYWDNLNIELWRKIDIGTKQFCAWIRVKKCELDWMTTLYLNVSSWWSCFSWAVLF